MCRTGVPAVQVYRPDRHVNIDLLPEAVQDGHQAVDRETAELGIADAGELAVIDPAQLCRLTGRQFLVIEHADNLGGQKGLGLLDIGVRVAKVTENVPAATNQF
jgi:hypothetical protein